MMDLGKRGLRPSVRYVDHVHRAANSLVGARWQPGGCDAVDVLRKEDCEIVEGMRIRIHTLLKAAIDAWYGKRWTEFCENVRAARPLLPPLAALLCRGATGRWVRDAMRSLAARLPDEPKHKEKEDAA